MARLADRLEASGWLKRRPHPQDRRAKCLYTTDKAHARLEEMRALADAVQEEALQGVQPRQRAQLIDLLLRVKRNLNAAQDADRPPTNAAPLRLK